jgi:hypothetical protein
MTVPRARASVVGVAAAGLVAAAAYLVFVRTPPGPRSLRVFDPDRMAGLELDMWQAYYRHENVRLFKGLVTMLHEQNRYPWAKAIGAGFHLARAARTFGDARSDYERVLPDLERAYTTARDWTHAGFDPAAVARAELAWWVARRVPGQDDPDHVGSLMADEYALLYETRRERVLDAAVLRARAGRLRDEGGERADWEAVSTLLVESYHRLHEAVGPGA